MTLDKLKVTARQHEQREEWGAAIELYRQSIRAAEAAGEGADPALYNRIGDLAHKAGQDGAACEAWEQAATRYGEQGFFNNAIALCGKILRVDGARIGTHLALARYHAKKRVIYEVRHHLTAYCDQMARRGAEADAAAALHDFGAEFPSWRELQALVNELLGRESDAEAEAADERNGEAGGDLVFLDVEPGRIAMPPSMAGGDTSFVIEHTSRSDVAAPESALPRMDGLAPTVPVVPGAALPDAPAVENLLNVEEPAKAAGPTRALAGLEGVRLAEPGVDVVPRVVDGLQVTAPTAPTVGVPVAEGLEIAIPVSAPTPGRTDAAPTPVSPLSPPPELTATPSDPLSNRARAHARFERGDRAGVTADLEPVLSGHIAVEEWLHAWQVASELIESEPPTIVRHQARVELAARMRDHGRLCEAYLALGDALLAEGSADKAIAVYRRVLEIDETNAVAREALTRMHPEAPTESGPDGFIDLGAMLIDSGPRTTRMRTETTAISADEDETFREALAEFKRAIDQNLPVEDHQAHYDLGIAFKEMGLLTEAISEFQKALRSPEGRLRTSEVLGQAFFDQGRPAVAEAMLRSVVKGDEGDADKIGVLYWLGRALEAQGKVEEARTCFERVLAVDVGFQDVTDRLSQLGSGGTA